MCAHHNHSFPLRNAIIKILPPGYRNALFYDFWAGGIVFDRFQYIFNDILPAHFQYSREFSVRFFGKGDTQIGKSDIFPFPPEMEKHHPEQGTAFIHKIEWEDTECPKQ
jgi:hypothetical protein